ncbi:hypothetical protein [Ferrovibrio sp.]|uniref:hypothetical protein n=1 Tax=Ferrovibrio sp. TaxID=1917215 RepID=UPI0026148CD6|nr:hypothetical protein [Ferrovibrio sp.]
MCAIALIFRVAVICILSLSAAYAATVEVPSCYTIVEAGQAASKAKRELVVVVDQTAKFDAGLQETANKKIQKFIKPGDRVVLVSFSAFVKERYSEVVLEAILDQDIPENKKFTTGKVALAKMAKCLQEQESATRNLVAGHLKKIFDESSTNLPNTEILGTLTMLSREFLSTKKAERQYLFILSDMLENSATTSFYANNKVRRIEPDKEIDKARLANMIGQLNGVEVYIHGAGYTDDGKYKSSVEMKAIEDFWGKWIRASGGVLRGYGAPSLFPEIGQ